MMISDDFALLLNAKFLVVRGELRKRKRSGERVFGSPKAKFHIVRVELRKKKKKC